MPTPLPSSFASAAAGNTQDSSTRAAGGEWPRIRMNGATQTFRRPSLATNPSHNRDTSQTNTTSSTTPTVGAYIPPHMTSNYQSSGLRNGATSESRYSKEQLLNVYKALRESGNLGKSLADYFVADWDPHVATPTANGAWGKRDDQHQHHPHHKDNHSGPEVCWDHGGQMEPLGLMGMTDDEKELFSVSVNSPLKPPPTNASKDNAGSGVGGRKTSFSHSQNHMNSFNTSSPGTGRPGPRRRETGESTANSMSPTTTGSRFFRDESVMSTPSLLRRKTDFRDTTPNLKSDDKEKENSRDGGPDAASPFGSLKRSITNPLSAGLAGTTSPWQSASHSASFSPMGAFGAFSLGSAAAQTPTSEKKAGFGSLRGESRFKGLLSKDSSEDIGASVKEKPSISNLERLPEDDGDTRSQSPWGEPVKTRAARSETNPFSEEPRSGSAALGGSQDVATTSQGPDQLGFSAFGMTSTLPGFRELMQSHEGSRNPTPSLLQGHEPTSPTNTNPYQSPHGEKTDVDDVDTDGSDVQHSHHPGISGLRDASGPFGSIRRIGSGVDLPSIDRSQTSSVGANRGFASLGGLGGLPSLGGSAGWPSSAAVGTPSRERSAFSTGFGDPIFGSMGDLQSPSLSTLGGGGLFSPHTGITGTGSIGRSSKLGSLFPAAMQEQMQGDQIRQEAGGMDDGTIHSGEKTDRSLIGGSPAKSKSPWKDKSLSSRGSDFSALDGVDIGSPLIRREDPQQADKQSQLGQPASTSAAQTPVSAVGSIPTTLAFSLDAPQPSQTPAQPVSNVGSSSVPPAQQRTMVMPDRMRWIYRDPQGNIQGPWTGLEMHDWFKAGFFSPDLQIKKLEDPEFEPLAQLVRRIGNSREPFLVPQIGIPHGPDPTPGPWSGSSSGTAQPPFPGSFPSFGTTLTAEQQNALERRKQEEQYLMARQKEHLAQQQALMKQMQLQGLPHAIHPPQLQHHSSAHSLHSQPSFGSVTSPVGYQPSPIQGPIQQPQAVPPFFDAATPVRQNALPNVVPQMLGTDLVSGQDQLPALLERLNVSRPDPFAFGSPSSPFAARQPDNFHSQQVASMLQDRARLQQEQEQFDNTHGDNVFDQQAREERLRQFHALRGQDGEFGMRTAEGLPSHPPTAPSQQSEPEATASPQEKPATSSTAQVPQPAFASNEPALTLSQQVKKAASVQRQQQEHEQQQRQKQQDAQNEAATTAKADNGLPQPFPPPPSASPLPAPAAQRNRQNVAESLAAGSRSQTQTPVEAPTTSIAPWAKEATEIPKGPSLKEIQEAEARNAAQREELAAAARRAQLLAEQERLSQAQAQTPGLPSTANWASAGSPTPTPTGSVWNNKGQSAGAGGPAKKTLAQIQKEEEARKQRLAASAAAAAAQTAATSPAPPPSTGKRYADLASKAPAATPAAPASTTAGSGAWTTVGAGGKPKLPPAAPTAPTAPTAPRSNSGNVPVTAPAAKPRPTPAPRTATVGSTPSSAPNPNRAMEEFTKWAKLSLGKGLNSGINVDDFVQQLVLLPAEAEIISDSVYANSQTLDGRRFAEEFIRRRKLADKGIVDPVSVSAFGSQNNNSGGWSEVAKKGSYNAHRDEDNSNAAFKVVAPRKKGKR